MIASLLLTFVMHDLCNPSACILSFACGEHDDVSCICEGRSMTGPSPDVHFLHWTAIELCCKFCYWAPFSFSTRLKYDQSCQSYLILGFNSSLCLQFFSLEVTSRLRTFFFKPDSSFYRFLMFCCCNQIGTCHHFPSACVLFHIWCGVRSILLGMWD